MTGVKIDTEVLAASGRTLSARAIELENSIREMCGDPSLNINSARQLGEALFNRLKIDPNPKKTKTKQFRTDEEYLQMLTDRHPVVGAILEYRGIKKLLSTYIEALPQLVNPSTGRIHTSFNQAVTATGRLSSTNPNLQNIPFLENREFDVREFYFELEKEPYASVEQVYVIAHNIYSSAGTLVEIAKGNDNVTAIGFPGTSILGMGIG